jgi:hypothetical protein
MGAARTDYLAFDGLIDEADWRGRLNRNSCRCEGNINNVDNAGVKSFANG